MSRIVLPTNTSAGMPLCIATTALLTNRKRYWLSNIARPIADVLEQDANSCASRSFMAPNRLCSPKVRLLGPIPSTIEQCLELWRQRLDYMSLGRLLVKLDTSSHVCYSGCLRPKSSCAALFWL